MMGSSLFDMFRNQSSGASHPMAQMLQQFNQFKSGFSGDPKQEVQKLLQSGQMSQEQFQKLSQAATQFQKMMGGRF